MEEWNTILGPKFFSDRAWKGAVDGANREKMRRMAELAWRKTLLVDGDLRKPAVHQMFDLPIEPGLSEVLRGDIDSNEAIKATPLSRLWLMPGGQWDPYAQQALAQEGVGKLFDQLAEEYDMMIVDSCPVLPVADTLLLVLVRPGITGLAQVQLPPDSDLASVRRKVAHDLFYIGHGNLWLDFRLLFVTAFYLVGLSGTWPCRVVRIPRGRRIEDDYQGLIQQTEEQRTTDTDALRLPTQPPSQPQPQTV